MPAWPGRWLLRSDKRQLSQPPRLPAQPCRRNGEDHRQHIVSFSSNQLQCGEDIVDDIVGMFEPAREAQQAVADTTLRPRCRGKSLVCCRSRMCDETLCVSQIVADTNQPQRVLKPKGGRLPAFHLEGNQR